jgi:type II secretion system protein H
MDNVGAVAVEILGLSRTAEPARSTLAGTARSCRGYSLSELVVVIAIIGIMGAAAVPWLLSALPGATVTWGAREIQGSLMRAKMLAMSTRQTICVQVVSGGYQFVQGGCAGTVWTGPGTDSTGTFRPSPNSFTVTNGGASPIFTPFGNASQTGVLTVTAQGGGSRTVTVTASGRVTIP